MTTTPTTIKTPIMSNLLGNSNFIWTVFPTGGTISPNIEWVKLRMFPESAGDTTTTFFTGMSNLWEATDGTLMIIYVSGGATIYSKLDRGGDITDLKLRSPSFQLELQVLAAFGGFSSANGDMYLSGA